MKASATEQEVEVSVEMDNDGRLLADVTPAGETFWGFDGRWTKKREFFVCFAIGNTNDYSTNNTLSLGIQSTDETYSSSPLPSVVNGDGKKCYDAIVELFGPEAALKDRKDPKLEVVVGHGGMGAWGGESPAFRHWTRDMRRLTMFSYACKDAY